jgi:hypothetical protein
MMPFRLLFALTVAGLLTSCAAPPALKTTSEQSINVTIVGHRGAGSMSMGIFDDDFDCYGPKGIVLGSSHTQILNVPAKPWQTYTFGFAEIIAGGVHQCVGTASFRTDNAHEYRVEFDGTASGQCSMHVQGRIAGSQDAMTDVPIEVRERSTPFFDMKGPFCKADPRYEGSSNYSEPRH